MDFLGASTDANNRESNSYTPRIRQLYAEYDNDNYHFHTTFGQQWSLLTQERVGMLNGAENTPLTIDAQYVVGFNWVRQPAIRFVGIGTRRCGSASRSSSPEGVIAGGSSERHDRRPPLPQAQPPISSSPTSTTPARVRRHLNGTTTCTNNIAPDLIEKIAADPGWGHYEAFGATALVRRRREPGHEPPWVAPIGRQKTTFGWGVGGNVLLPVIPKYLDLQGSVMTGQGIGRYGSSQLARRRRRADRYAQRSKQTSFLVGAVGHPWAGNDIYAYYGQEMQNSNSWTVNGDAGWLGAIRTIRMTNCAIEAAAGSAV